MIMRIKFTNPLGEQFVMRKRIFRRLQEAFQENNIEFAYRNVTVYKPSEDNVTESGTESRPQRPTDAKFQGATTVAILHEEEKTEGSEGDVK